MKRTTGVWIFFATVAMFFVNALFRFVAWIILSCQLHFDVQHPLFIYLKRTESDSYFITLIFLIILIIRAVKHMHK